MAKNRSRRGYTTTDSYQVLKSESADEEKVKNSLTRKIIDWQDEFQQKYPELTPEELDFIRNHLVNTRDIKYGFAEGMGTYGLRQAQLGRVETYGAFKKNDYKVGDTLKGKGVFKAFSGDLETTMTKLQNKSNGHWVIYRTNGDVNFFPANTYSPQGWYDYENEVWVEPKKLKITNITTIEGGDVYGKTVKELKLDYGKDPYWGTKRYVQGYKELKGDSKDYFNNGKTYKKFPHKNIPPMTVTIVDLEHIE